MIVSYKGKLVESVAAGKVQKGFPADILRVAERRLAAVANAASLNDLRSPPGNHLEALDGDRTGQHSIRISDQWRICFKWTDAGPEDVEIIASHKQTDEPVNQLNCETWIGIAS